MFVFQNDNWHYYLFLSILAIHHEPNNRYSRPEPIIYGGEIDQPKNYIENTIQHTMAEFSCLVWILSTCISQYKLISELSESFTDGFCLLLWLIKDQIIMKT